MRVLHLRAVGKDHRLTRRRGRHRPGITSTTRSVFAGARRQTQRTRPRLSKSTPLRADHGHPRAPDQQNRRRARSCSRLPPVAQTGRHVAASARAMCQYNRAADDTTHEPSRPEYRIGAVLLARGPLRQERILSALQKARLATFSFGASSSSPLLALVTTDRARTSSQRGRTARGWSKKSAPLRRCRGARASRRRRCTKRTPAKSGQEDANRCKIGSLERPLGLCEPAEPRARGETARLRGRRADKG